MSFFELRDERELDCRVPAQLLERVRYVLRMQTVHHQNENTLRWVVEAVQYFTLKPVQELLSLLSGVDILRLHDVIENDVGRANARDGPAGCGMKYATSRRRGK